MSRKSRRWVETGKSLLILLLTVSAAFLLFASPLIQDSGISALLQDNLAAAPNSTSSPAGLSSAAIPARMAVRSDMGLYGVQYDQHSADTLFDQAGPLLGEALSTAENPAELTAGQWQALLSGKCIYFDFTCPVPLSALCSWLKDGADNPALADSARYILLADKGDGTLALCFYSQERSAYLSCETGLDSALHLVPLLNSVTPNSAFFAFEDDSLPAIISGHTLFTGETLSPEIYTSATPLLSDTSFTSQLLSALFFADQNRATVSEGVLYVDGEDTLRLTGDGIVEYTASDSGKYPVGAGISGAVDAAWVLAEQALSPICGDARLYLMSAETNPDEEGSYTITFGYMLNGSVVDLYEQGWAARFHVQNGSIRDFTLYLRSYTSSGQTKLLLPAEKAAAALTALTSTQKELVIQYQDNGTTAAEPGWVGR